MIAGVVLAAGRSTRLGQPKQLLPFRDRPLLSWALAAMTASKVDITHVVLGHEAERLQREVDLRGAEVILNPRYDDGLSTSLQAALDRLEHNGAIRAAVIAVGDQPLLAASTIDALVDAHMTTGQPIVAADYGDHQGTPLLLHRSVWPRARALSGDRGAGRLLQLYPDLVATVPVDPSIAADIDTWNDYEQLYKQP